MTEQLSMTDAPATGYEVAHVQRAPLEHANGGPTTETLLELAIREKVDVSVLERLVALKERTEDRNARAAFIEAMSRFQESVSQIPQTRTAKIVSKKSGTSFTYKYAQLQDIVRAVKGPLKENGLSYVWTGGRIENGNLYIVCKLRHVDGHEETSEFPVPLDGVEHMSPSQRNGAAYTYGRRQSLVAVLGLAMADEDTDAAQSEAEAAEFITENEAADLASLADEVGANPEKFLPIFGVKKFGELRKSDVATARRFLEQKRK